MLVLISSLLGLAFREWKGCKRRIWVVLGGSLAALVGAVLMLAFGSRLAEFAAAEH